jgi:hypothetical protein
MFYVRGPLAYMHHRVTIAEMWIIFEALAGGQTWRADMNERLHNCLRMRRKGLRRIDTRLLYISDVFTFAGYKKKCDFCYTHSSLRLWLMNSLCCIMWFRFRTKISVFVFSLLFQWQDFWDKVWRAKQKCTRVVHFFSGRPSDLRNLVKKDCPLDIFRLFSQQFSKYKSMRQSGTLISIWIYMTKRSYPRFGITIFDTYLFLALLIDMVYDAPRSLKEYC